MICRGTLSSSAIAAKATSSVDETMAPSTNATPQLMPGIIACAIAATAIVVTMTKPNAIWKIQSAPARNSLVGAVTLSQYSSGGKKTSNTSSGGSGNVGTPGM